MTKIQIDDGKTEEKKSTSSVKPAKKTVRKILVTDGKEGISSAATHTNVQKSTTLSRKYVKKPASKTANTTAKTTTAIKPDAKSKTFARIVAKNAAREEAKKAIAARTAARALAKAEAKKAAEKKAEEKRAELKKREEAKRAEAAKREEAKRAEAAKRAAEKKQRATSKLTEKRLRAEREAAAKAAKIAKVKAEKEAKLARIKAEKEAKLAQATAAKMAKKQSAQHKPTGVRPTLKMPKMRKSAKNEERALKSATTVVKNMEKGEPAPKMERTFKKKHKARHIFFALLCSGATVAALVAFVHFSIPDLSVRVAAFQTGIDATYPTFTPRGYSLSGVTSDKNDVVTISYSGPDGASFNLSEEKSTWDSTALLNNYVKKNYPNDFTTLREQGITIYVRGEKASWVNGGVLYKIEAAGKHLTKEQIRNIATSL